MSICKIVRKINYDAITDGFRKATDSNITALPLGRLWMQYGPSAHIACQAWAQEIVFKLDGQPAKYDGERLLVDGAFFANGMIQRFHKGNLKGTPVLGNFHTRLAMLTKGVWFQEGKGRAKGGTPKLLQDLNDTAYWIICDVLSIPKKVAFTLVPSPLLITEVEADRLNTGGWSPNQFYRFVDSHLPKVEPKKKQPVITEEVITPTES